MNPSLPSLRSGLAATAAPLWGRPALRKGSDPITHIQTIERVQSRLPSGAG